MRAWAKSNKKMKKNDKSYEQSENLKAILGKINIFLFCENCN